MVIALPYGGASLRFRVADELVGAVLRPQTNPRPRKISDIVNEALNAPIGSPPLENLLSPGRRVAIVVDDVTRKTPVGEILPLILERILSRGLPLEEICVVIALGTHRPLEPAEIVTKLGAEYAHRLNIVNTPCDDAGAFEYLGETKDRIPAEILSAVVQADIRIAIGAILPHMDTGFSGGGKMMLPGVASRRTVDAFHIRSAQRTGNQLGKKDAIARQTLEKFVAEKLRLHFIVNVVMDDRHRMAHCVAGDFIAAHRRGVALAQSIYGVQVPERFPVVIANAYPMEVDFWQSTKAIYSGELITADGGLLVLVSPCPEGIDAHPKFTAYLAKAPEELMSLGENADVEDPTALAFAVGMTRMRERIRFALVSPGIPDRLAHQMRMTPYASVEAALASESGRLNKGSIGVLTHGGTTLPLID
ncbi:MAG: nickel-dependent lactate racemase [Desulfosarcinaceae bacterium]|jgi:nickel-dependent lactate racemase